MRIIYYNSWKFLFNWLINFITKMCVKKLTILIIYKAIYIIFSVNSTECILINVYNHVNYIYYYTFSTVPQHNWIFNTVHRLTVQTLHITFAVPFSCAWWHYQFNFNYKTPTQKLQLKSDRRKEPMLRSRAREAERKRQRKEREREDRECNFILILIVTADCLLSAPLFG